MNWNPAYFLSLLVFSTTLSSSFGGRFGQLFGFSDGDIIRDDADFMDNTIGFFGRALTTSGDKPLLKSLDYLEEDGDGIKLGCRFDLGTDDKKIRALYIEDVKGRRELAKVGSTIARFINSDKIEQERVIPLRKFPKDCLRQLFGISTGDKGCPQGPAGASGPAGSPGPAGPNGAPGYPGNPGIAGLDGWDGADGPAGNAGATGPTGDAGLQGATGVAGPQGNEGPAGTDGADGPNGLNGNPGNPGNPGPQGSAGLPGSDGLAGETGATGANGANGQPGSNGSPGPNGIPAPNTGWGWSATDSTKVYAIAQNYDTASTKKYGMSEQLSDAGEVSEISQSLAVAGVKLSETSKPLVDTGIQVPKIPVPWTATDKKPSSWITDSEGRPLQLSNFWQYGRHDQEVVGSA